MLEDGDDTFPRNFGIHLQGYTVSEHIRIHCKISAVRASKPKPVIKP
jgi:hypothetical protein